MYKFKMCFRLIARYFGPNSPLGPAVSAFLLIFCIFLVVVVVTPVVFWLLSRTVFPVVFWYWSFWR